MDLQPTLENDLVHIRPLKIADIVSLYEVSKDPKIWEQHPCKRYLRPEFEKFFEESIASKGALTILDKRTNAIIGSSRYKKFDGFPDVVEIGWTFISRQFWGGKYNTTIKNLMIEHAFHFVNNIVLYVDKNNIRSQKAVKKIGGKIIEASQLTVFPKTSEDNITFVIQNTKPKCVLVTI